MSWQPIETAPKDGTKILIVNSDGEIGVAAFVPEWYERKEFVRAAKDGDVYKTVREDIGYWDTNEACCPTHWMPLLAAPEKTE